MQTTHELKQIISIYKSIKQTKSKVSGSEKEKNRCRFLSFILTKFCDSNLQGFGYVLWLKH